jgi:hypothetical protein
MKSASALLRLFPRPGALWALFPLFWAVALPLMLLAERGHSPLALWYSEPAALGAAWQVLLLVGAVLGGTVTAVRMDLRDTPLAALLPGARDGLLAGTVLCAAVAAAGMAAVVGHVAGVTVLLPSFGVAALAFALGATAMDQGFARTVRWGAFALVIAGAALGGELAALAAAQPVVVLLAGVAAAGVLLRSAFPPLDVALWRRVAPAQRTGAQVRGRGRAGPEWRTSSVGAGLAHWLAAAAYESGSAGPGRYIAVHGALAAFCAAFGWLAADPALALVMTGALLVNPRLQLTTRLLHPLSRTDRACVAVAGAQVSLLLLFGMIAGAVAVLGALGVPPIQYFADDAQRLLTWPVVLVAGLALAPVAQWAALRQPRTTAPYTVRAMVHWVAFIVAARVAIKAAAALPTPDVAVFAVAGVVIHSLLVVAVRRNHARADLLPASQ